MLLIELQTYIIEDPPTPQWQRPPRLLAPKIPPSAAELNAYASHGSMYNQTTSESFSGSSSQPLSSRTIPRPTMLAPSRVESVGRALPPSSSAQHAKKAGLGKTRTNFWTQVELETLGKLCVPTLGPSGGCHSMGKGFWQTVADELPGRTAKACHTQWTALRKRRTAAAGAKPRVAAEQVLLSRPSQVVGHEGRRSSRKVWSPSESEALVKLCSARPRGEVGWEAVLQGFPGRTLKSLKTKWQRAQRRIPRKRMTDVHSGGFEDRKQTESESEDEDAEGELED